MAEETGISWADATFNPWIGCTEVGPGCTFCYARIENDRRKWTDGWGPGVPRYHTSHNNWQKVRSWNAHPYRLIGEYALHRRPRVFCASLADVLDNEVPDAWRTELWDLIRECKNLQWLIVTKRIGNAAKMLPPDWGDGWPHVVLISTVVNQDEADRDIPKLLATPARLRGLSIEPMLGPVDLHRFLRDGEYLRYCDAVGGPEPKMPPGIDWVICGGESGKIGDARLMEFGWVLPLAAQCDEAGVAFHFKQIGSVHTGWPRAVSDNLGISGKGKDPAEWPPFLREQQFPPQLVA